MSFSIQWTVDAISSFNQNIDYLEQDWSTIVANEFLDRVEEILEKEPTHICSLSIGLRTEYTNA